jgi:hypothetical protein
VLGPISLRFDWNAARRAAKVAAMLGLDDLKTVGNAIHMGAPTVPLRKPGCAGFLASGTSKIFNPVVEDDHPSIMSARKGGSRQLSCHNQTGPICSWVMSGSGSFSEVSGRIREVRFARLGGGTNRTNVAA